VNHQLQKSCIANQQLPKCGIANQQPQKRGTIKPTAANEVVKRQI